MLSVSPNNIKCIKIDIQTHCYDRGILFLVITEHFKCLKDKATDKATDKAKLNMSYNNNGYPPRRGRFIIGDDDERKSPTSINSINTQPMRPSKRMQRQQAKAIGMKSAKPNQTPITVWSSFTMKKVVNSPIPKKQNRRRTNSLTAPTPTSSPMVAPMDLNENTADKNFVLDGGSSYNMGYEELQNQLMQAGEYIKQLEYTNSMLMQMGGWMSTQYVGVVDVFDDYDKELQELMEEHAADEAGVILADEEAAREEFEMEETNDIYEEECKTSEPEQDVDGWQCVMGGKKKKPTQSPQPTQQKITSVNSWANLALYGDSDDE